MSAAKSWEAKKGPGIGAKKGEWLLMFVCVVAEGCREVGRQSLGGRGMFGRGSVCCCCLFAWGVSGR